MSDELKPCPFCGWGTICEVITVPFRHKCGCHACGASTANYRTWDEAVEAWNTRAATTIGKVQVEIEPVFHGTLTAEQVRKVVCRNSTYNDIYKVYQVSHADMQAIADELNEALGGGECVMNRVKMFPEQKDCIFECWECSACKRTNDEHRPRFCPNCGARVRKKVER